MPQPADAYLPGSPLVARESSGRLSSGSRDDTAAQQLGRQGSGGGSRPALRYGGSSSAFYAETDAGARKLHELHHAAQQDGALSPPSQSRAATGAKGRWMRARTFVRTTFAISRDLKDLKAMVGSVSRGTTEEIEARLLNEELKKQKGVIMPDTVFRYAWDALQVLFLVYVAVVVPFRVCFNVQPALWSGVWWWELIIDIYFIVDVILNFFFAYEDPEEYGKIVVDRGRIRKKYLTGWFTFDFISILPLSYYQQLQSAEAAEGGANTKVRVVQALSTR